MAKKRLKDKILNVANKYNNDNVVKHAELRNIYYGCDKEAKKSKKLHTLKSRYRAAEDYVKNKAGSLSAEERKYIIDLALAFTDYDTKLDKKRKSENYKKAITEVRKAYIENTLGSMVNEYSKELPPVEKTEVKHDGKLENSVREDNPKGGLLSRLSRHYKCMIVAAAMFVAGAVGGYYYHKQQPPQKNYTIVLPQKKPEKKIIKKPENKKIEKKYVAPKKEENLVTKKTEEPKKEPEKKKEQVQEKKPSLEESLYEIELKYGTVPIKNVEKHVIDHKAKKILGHTLKTYTVKDEKVKNSLSYSVKDMYLELLRAMEKNADVEYLHVKRSKKGIVPVLEIEFSNKENESISEHDTGKHDRNNGFLTNTSIINFDGQSESSQGGYELRIKLEGSPKEKALKALSFIQKGIHNANSQNFFHTYWDKRDKNRPVVEGHMIYTDKGNDENFKLKGILFTQQGTKIEVVNNDEDIKVGEEEQHPSP